MTRWIAAVIVVGLASPGLGRAQDAPAEPEPSDAAVEADEATPPPPRTGLVPATVRFGTAEPVVGVRYLADPILEDTDGGGLAVRLLDPDRYDLLCDAPCARELPRGHYALAFERRGTVARMREPLGVDGPTAVAIRWEDRSGERLAGVLTLALGIPVAALLSIVPPLVELPSGGLGPLSYGLAGAASAVLIASLIVGIALLYTQDGARFETTPLPDDDADLYSEDWR